MAQELPDVDLWMIHPDLTKTPKLSFPAGYQMRFYHDGDVESWVDIQRLADSLYKVNAETFASYLPGDIDELSQRVMFLVDPSGRDIGSITAWQKDDWKFDNLTQKHIGQVHWVAITADHQGRGLARPMLSACCQRMLELGHSQACLSTNTKRIPAVNLYRKFGFEPILKTDAQKEAWNDIAPKLHYEENK
ncbi:MAG: GNAT family N-acetyltransferase [Anaerolineae bacterium]